MTKLFVYGSLKKGFGNHRLLETSEFLGEETLPKEQGFHMISLGSFPAIVPNSIQATPIYGEVYEINEPVFIRIDRLEGYPTFYNRRLVPTKYGAAWVYFLKSPHSPDMIIPDGAWTNTRR
jgi:gamma-glutamylcyclotransferase (GGCT)/AIG2-like uncharacterized protein YtfP